MIVPFAKGQKGQGPQQPQPSETDLLMALAAMHSLGRLSSDSAKAKSKPEDPSLA